jgi:hypothetical protein
MSGLLTRTIPVWCGVNLTPQEVSHMFHQFGYAKVYPAQFGVDDYTSAWDHVYSHIFKPP